MHSNNKQLEPVSFGSILVGTWFKDIVEGAWHLKTSSIKGMYQSCGTRFEPTFLKSETVFVE
jgi:hypothetical protein